MEDKIDLILYKLKDLKKEIGEVKAIVEAHRIEHGFAKMQDGGVNANFGGQQQQQGPPGMMGGGMPMGWPWHGWWLSTAWYGCSYARPIQTTWHVKSLF